MIKSVKLGTWNMNGGDEAKKRFENNLIKNDGLSLKYCVNIKKIAIKN